MKLCTKCLYPTTKPDLEFVNGVCSACRNAMEKGIRDWEARGKLLEQLAERYRGLKPWDCIIPVSGGKDSHFIVKP